MKELKLKELKLKGAKVEGVKVKGLKLEESKLEELESLLKELLKFTSKGAILQEVKVTVSIYSSP